MRNDSTDALWKIFAEELENAKAAAKAVDPYKALAVEAAKLRDAMKEEGFDLFDAERVAINFAQKMMEREIAIMKPF
ncbi:hypothetical protein SAMN05421505_11286 [Sinosporangium album]|uniref:Uncharacterized protein n=1 Tax=Sinosporangium album TaxID=504805 RepID=A0A1G8AB18_9ACTN|nr:hypothetical protein [Sinosporangium album]SDH18132.1 hypothetical protein SAMN05421505_11286 [Sinosporangium album]